MKASQPGCADEPAELGKLTGNPQHLRSFARNRQDRHLSPALGAFHVQKSSINALQLINTHAMVPASSHSVILVFSPRVGGFQLSSTLRCGSATPEKSPGCAPRPVVQVDRNGKCNRQCRPMRMIGVHERATRAEMAVARAGPWVCLSEAGDPLGCSKGEGESRNIGVGRRMNLWLRATCSFPSCLLATSRKLRRALQLASACCLRSLPDGHFGSGAV